MSDMEYPACIRELYESEIFGEAASLAVLAVTKNERDRYHMGTLLQLETETKARLRPFLTKHGITLSEQMPLNDVDGIVDAYKEHNWQEFAAAIKPVVDDFLHRFKEIVQLGPEEDRDVLESMVRHESAILQWIELESKGADDSSLDSIIAELQYPLPKPSSL